MFRVHTGPTEIFNNTINIIIMRVISNRVYARVTNKQQITELIKYIAIYWFNCNLFESCRKSRSPANYIQRNHQLEKCQSSKSMK